MSDVNAAFVHGFVDSAAMSMSSSSATVDKSEKSTAAATAAAKERIMAAEQLAGMAGQSVGNPSSPSSLPNAMSQPRPPSTVTSPPPGAPPPPQPAGDAAPDPRKSAEASHRLHSRRGSGAIGGGGGETRRTPPPPPPPAGGTPARDAEEAGAVGEDCARIELPEGEGTASSTAGPAGIAPANEASRAEAAAAPAGAEGLVARIPKKAGRGAAARTNGNKKKGQRGGHPGDAKGCGGRAKGKGVRRGSAPKGTVEGSAEDARRGVPLAPSPRGGSPRSPGQKASKALSEVPPPPLSEPGAAHSSANVVEESEGTAAPPPEEEAEEGGNIQFLPLDRPRRDAPNYDDRVTFDGGIDERVASIPPEDRASAARGETSGGGTAAAAEKPSSPLRRAAGGRSAFREAMENGFPTMAPPMTASSPVPGLRSKREKPSEKSLGKKKKKKKGGKKSRDRESIGDDGLCLLDDDAAAASRKKAKKQPRFQQNDIGGGAPAVGIEPPSPKKGKKRRRGKSDADVVAGGEPSTGPKCKKRCWDKRTGRKSEGGPPPPSPSGALGSSGNPFPPPASYAGAARPRQYVISSDENPRRFFNPLLRMPQFPSGGGAHNPSGRSSPRIEDIPQAGELWNLADIHLADPDTWPISYLARVLGFDVPEEGVGREFSGAFDPASVPVLADRSDVATKVGNLAEAEIAEGSEEAGNARTSVPYESDARLFARRVWKRNQGVSSRAIAAAASAVSSSSDDTARGMAITNNASAAISRAQNGMADDLNLSYCDPLWANILSSYRGYKFNEEDFKDLIGKGMGFEDKLNEHCLGFARERGVLKKETKEEGMNERRDKTSGVEKAGECIEEKQDKAGKEDERKDDSEVNGKKEEGEGSDLNFRFGTVADEESLTSLADRCQWKFHPKHHLSSSLRSQGHFCIVAEKVSTPSSSSVAGEKKQVVAFLQYRFCWYLVGEKRVGVSKDKISELVIFIDNLVYANAKHARGECSKDEQATTNIAAKEMETGEDAEKSTKSPISAKELETAKVILMSLALVHGAVRGGIWYGMTEPPRAQVPFFMKYFRMSNVGRDESSDTVPLVFDIKKCHFKYAILLLEETLNLWQQKTTISMMCSNQKDQKYHNAAGSERMIVHLHNSDKNGPGFLSHVKIEEKEPWTNKQMAHIRLVRNLNADVDLFSVSSAATVPGDIKEGQEEMVHMSPIDLSTIDISTDWNVMRLFPLRSLDPAQEKIQPKEVETVSSVGSGYLSSDILSELQKKQAQLLSLESDIEKSSRTILSKAYSEQTAFAAGDHILKAERDRQKLAEYEAVQTRLREAELAWQAQLDQDMDAVCDVCHDGEVTPDNQIIFCDACNVAVHQRCYGIDAIPSGAYFCHTCKYFEVDKEVNAARRRGGQVVKITRPSVVCELCPRRQGAFVEVQCKVPTKKARWVHVGCAKWQGMNYVDAEKKDKIEDLTALKKHFQVQDIVCCLCKSGIGALHPCRAQGCDKWMHLTCARSLGKCSVQHGENCEGFYEIDAMDYPPWTLACPKHSEINPKSPQEEEGKNNFLTEEQLQAIAASYPPEPIPPKPFNRMVHSERKEYWSDPENLQEFFDKVMNSLDGAKCALCEMPADPAIDKRCDKCGVFSHADCADPARGEGATCLACRFAEEKANSLRQYEEPKCHMCSHPNASVGPMLRTYAKPVSMKGWKGKTNAFQRSIFGKDKFCHALCGMWHPSCHTENVDPGEDTVINCSNIVMANGRDHTSHQYRCALCGLHSGAKVDCCVKGCVAPGGSRHAAKFHVTCARQAGLEVLAEHDSMSVKCFRHVSCGYVFRARLEDMKEIELTRFSSNTFKPTNPMTWGHASSLFHAAVNILRTLGWAWRWAEWWVEGGDNWEPLLEPGQVESEMTEEELRIVHSTPESRAKDARRCRLVAFSAALRNRDYDKEEGDDCEPLERALTAVISTCSLVGPLKKREVEFFVTWLALAYRSKSPILGFGDDKAPVASDGFCVHQVDGSPKYELGPNQPLPGKIEPLKGVHEPPVNEPDDFLKTPVSASPTRKIRNKRKSKKMRRKRAKDDDNGDDEDVLLDDLG